MAHARPAEPGPATVVAEAVVLDALQRLARDLVALRAEVATVGQRTDAVTTAFAARAAVEAAAG